MEVSVIAEPANGRTFIFYNQLINVKKGDEYMSVISAIKEYREKRFLKNLNDGYLWENAMVEDVFSGDWTAYYLFLNQRKAVEKAEKTKPDRDRFEVMKAILIPFLVLVTGEILLNVIANILSC
jgi:hypothetical protein